MNISPDRIPDELKSLNHWVVWRYETKEDGKITKVPYQSASGFRASSMDATTRSTFGTALAASTQGYDGIGFVLTVDDNYAGIDLDHCIDSDGVIAEWAAAIVREMDSYTEITPSGSGLRVWAKGKLPEGGRKRKTSDMEVEMYDAGRYLTITGHHTMNSPVAIEQRQGALESIHRRIFPEPTPVARMAEVTRVLTVSDSELIDAILASKQGNKFQALWNGDTSANGSDDSQADLALCSILAFWTQRNEARMDGLFRQSGLMREKWDRRTGPDATYGTLTLARACSNMNEVYQPPVELNLIVGSKSLENDGPAAEAVLAAAPEQLVPTPEPVRVIDGLFAIDAEKALLGGMLKSPECIAKAAGSEQELVGLGGKSHSELYTLILQLWKNGQAVTPITVAAQAEGEKWFEDAGGKSWLDSLTWCCEEIDRVPDYLAIVQDRSIRRLMLKAAEETKAAVYSEPDTETLVNESGQRFLKISRRQAGDSAESIGDLADRQFDYIVGRMLSGGVLDGISTGFRDLDSMTTGLKRKNLVIVAGRPSMGKTSLALQLAYHVARSEQLPVQIFSLEMSKEELTQRYLCSEARVNSQLVGIGGIDKNALSRLKQTKDELQSVPLWIDDSSQSLFQIHARSRAKASETGGLGLIVVDYLQQVQVGEKRGQAMNRTQAVEEVTRSFKQLAREMDCPLIALSQLSRAVEQREDKRPMLSDLRESGGIEADADLVAFVYRPSYYESRRKKDASDWGPLDPDEIIIGKHRNGAVGTVKVVFTPEFARFDDLGVDRGL